ncbi:patatin-like phospholipase family protein [Myxococcota bacterium]|nr:patatin-like phospholipase family protein [Myxococcota bacterium]
MRRLALVLVASALARPAAGAPDPAGGAAMPVVYTVSGGVSLGAYEAGFLYLAGEAAKRSGGRIRVPLYTGASAGSANAVIAALEQCAPSNDHPSEDLGFRAWMPVGHRELFVEDEVTPLSVFSRRALDHAVRLIEERWMRGLPEDCDVVIGVSVTRVEARRVEVGPGLTVPEQAEKLVIRLQGRGVGRPIRVTNYVDPALPVAQPLLPVSDDPDAPGAAARDFALVRSLVFASSAFPVAFAPEELELCMTTPDTSTTTAPTCTGATSRARFLDGGVFDNNPLRLAHALVDRGLVVGERGVSWRPRPSGGEGAPPDVLYVYLDPSTTAYPALEEARGDTHDLVSLLGLFSRELVATARAHELATLVESSDALRGRVRLTETNYPLVSAELGAFLGFFDRELRFFDFQLGMFDAWTDLFVRARPPEGLGLATFLGDDPRAIAADWRPFACLVSWYVDGHEALRGACDGPELERFRTLLQVSLDRLYDHCARLPSAALRGLRHPHCRAAIEGRPAPRLPGLALPDGFDPRRADDEPGFAHVLRLLAAYRFELRDLGLTADEARYGRVKIRRKLLGMINALADAQPDAASRTLLATLGRNAVNTIAYEPPKNWGYAGIGTVLEAGVSLLPFEWNESWIRLNVAATVAGLSTLFTPDDVDVRLGLFAGPELQLLFLTTPLVHPMFGVRGGWQVGSRDRFGAGECTEATTKDDQRACSQAVLHSYAAIAILERLRVQLTGAWFPARRSFDHKLFDVELAIGVHVF